jgi:hypothetical protein
VRTLTSRVGVGTDATEEPRRDVGQGWKLRPQPTLPRSSDPVLSGVRQLPDVPVLPRRPGRALLPHPSCVMTAPVHLPGHRLVAISYIEHSRYSTHEEAIKHV